MKRAFSLAEVLITLTIAGVIAMVTIPVITRSFEENQVTLYKSAFKTVESVISELTNDINLYPAGNFYYNSTNTLANYFCNNFKDKINVISTANCDSYTPYTAPNFTTSNGMRWFGFNNNFSTSVANVWVDVDGASKGTSTVGTDVLRIYITSNGKVYANDSTEINYLNN